MLNKRSFVELSHLNIVSSCVIFLAEDGSENDLVASLYEHTKSKSRCYLPCGLSFSPCISRDGKL